MTQPPPVIPPPAPERPASPSMLPTIVGYILLAWSVIGVLSMVASGVMMITNPATKTQGTVWTVLSFFFGTVAIGLLVATAIGLIRRLTWARKVGMGYVAFVVVFSILNLVVTDHHAAYASAMEPMNIPGDMVDMMAWVIAITTFCVGMLFPLALAIVLNVPAMKRALAEQPAAE